MQIWLKSERVAFWFRPGKSSKVMVESSTTVTPEIRSVSPAMCSAMPTIVVENEDPNTDAETPGTQIMW